MTKDTHDCPISLKQFPPGHLVGATLSFFETLGLPEVENEVWLGG